MRSFKVSQSPFVYIYPSMQTVFICMLVFLIPQVAMLFLTKSYEALFVIFAALLASLACEGLFNGKKATPVSWVVSILQGIMTGFLLPQTYSPVAVFVITFIVMIFAKQIFGDFASSWINPVALSVAICYILCTKCFPDFVITGSHLQEKNAILSLIRDGSVPVGKFDDVVSTFLNTNVFRRFGIEIPNGYVTMFWDSGSVIPAFRFNLLTLVASLFLFSYDMVDMVIPVVFAAVYGLLIHFSPASGLIGTKLYGDVFLAFLTSGVLFSSLFILQWYGTTPSTFFGKLLYGVFSGLLAYAILGYGTSSVGFVFVVLIMNFCTLFLGSYEQKSIKKAFKKNILPKIASFREITIV